MQSRRMQGDAGLEWQPGAIQPITDDGTAADRELEPQLVAATGGGEEFDEGNRARTCAVVGRPSPAPPPASSSAAGGIVAAPPGRPTSSDFLSSGRRRIVSCQSAQTPSGAGKRPSTIAR
jgi:hypothetical protein